MIKEIAEIFKREDDFVVAAHVQPDGDAIGALLAVGWLLKDLGKRRTLAVIDKNDVPPQYKFLPGIEQLATGNVFDGNVLVALDVANKSRLGPVAEALDAFPLSINIDHHPDNSEFARLNWLDTEVSSTAEMIYNLWLEIGLPLSREAAACIYVGMLTDTGRWQYSNTTSRSLEVAAKLIDAGVTPIDVFKRVYESYSVEWFKLLAVGLQKAVFDKQIGLAYTTIGPADLAATGANMAESENLVDWLRAVDAISCAMVLKETRQGDIKVSLRSKDPVDVGAMARAFGGGGHKNASGFIGKDKPEKIIENIKKWLTGSS